MIENVCDITVNVDEKLSIDKFNVDEENAHIVLKENPSDEEFRKLVLCCPAALYKVEDDGSKRFDYAGCLECGTCRSAARPSLRSGSIRSRPWASNIVSARIL